MQSSPLLSSPLLSSSLLPSLPIPPLLSPSLVPPPPLRFSPHPLHFPKHNPKLHNSTLCFSLPSYNFLPGSDPNTALVSSSLPNKPKFRIVPGGGTFSLGCAATARRYACWRARVRVACCVEGGKVSVVFIVLKASRIHKPKDPKRPTAHLLSLQTSNISNRSPHISRISLPPSPAPSSYTPRVGYRCRK